LSEVALNGFEAAFLPYAARMALREAAANELAQAAGNVPPVYLQDEDAA
jgi:hypothetical protein